MEPTSGALQFEGRYEDLRRIAEDMLRRERPDHTLSATALLHEVWLRMSQQDSAPVAEQQFRALAATWFRRVLVDHARKRRAEMRGGGAPKTTLHEGILLGLADPVELLALDECLGRLAALHERAGRVVELRVYGGLSVAETAAQVGASPRTVDEDWRFALAQLRRCLSVGREAQCPNEAN